MVWGLFTVEGLVASPVHRDAALAALHGRLRRLQLCEAASDPRIDQSWLFLPPACSRFREVRTWVAGQQRLRWLDAHGTGVVPDVVIRGQVLLLLAAQPHATARIARAHRQLALAEDLGLGGGQEGGRRVVSDDSVPGSTCRAGGSAGGLLWVGGGWVEAGRW